MFVLFVLFLVSYLWQGISLSQNQFQINQTKKEILKINNEISNIQTQFTQLRDANEKISKESKKVNEMISILEKAKKRKVSWSKILVHLSKLVPKDLWINKMALSEKEIHIIGTTFDNGNVSNFMVKLDNSDYFKQTSFTYTLKTSVAEKPVINFEITTHLNESMRK